MYEYRAKVLNWVDGDTLLVEIDLGFYVTRQERIRLARINAPEMNSPIPFQVKKAKHAKATGKRFCKINSTVVVQTQKSKRDMYARYIAEVLFNGKNLSDYLLEKKVVEIFEE